MKTTEIILKCEPKLKEALKKKALAQGESASSIIRMLIREFLKRK